MKMCTVALTDYNVTIGISFKKCHKHNTYMLFKICVFFILKSSVVFLHKPPDPLTVRH